MSYATPAPEPGHAIDALVAAFCELLYAPEVAVVSRLRGTGDVVAVNAYDDSIAAAYAVWENGDGMVTAEAHPIEDDTT